MYNILAGSVDVSSDSNNRHPNPGNPSRLRITNFAVFMAVFLFALASTGVF